MPEDAGRRAARRLPRGWLMAMITSCVRWLRGVTNPELNRTIWVVEQQRFWIEKARRRACRRVGGGRRSVQDAARLAQKVVSNRIAKFVE